MTIKVGEKLPSATLLEMKNGTPTPIKTDDFFAGKKVAVFALPGAFTPTCSAKHLPGFVQHAQELRNKGINAIACISVNDAFVMVPGARIRVLATMFTCWPTAMGISPAKSD